MNSAKTTVRHLKPMDVVLLKGLPDFLAVVKEVNEDYFSATFTFVLGGISHPITFQFDFARVVRVLEEDDVIEEVLYNDELRDLFKNISVSQ